MFVSIDHVILDIPIILVVSYTCVITYNLCIMVCLKYTPHTKYDIRRGVSQGGAP